MRKHSNNHQTLIGLVIVFSNLKLNIVKATYSKRTGHYFIGNFYITELEKKDWNLLTNITNPNSIHDGNTMIVYEKDIPVQMKKKYAQILLKRNAFKDIDIKMENLKIKMQELEDIKRYQKKFENIVNVKDDKTLLY